MGLQSRAARLSLRALTASSSLFLQAAERVLQQEHQLQGSELSLVPHYDVLEPEGLDENTSGRDHSAKLGLGATEHAHLEAGGPARALMDAGTVILGSEEPPGQSRASLSTGPIGSLEQTGSLSSEPMRSLEQAVSLGPTGSPGPVGLDSATGSPEQEWLESLGPVGSPEQEKLENLGPVGSVEQQELENLWPVESPEHEWLESLWPVGSPEQEGMESLGHVGSPEQEGQVDVVVSMEPGAMRFIQLYHEDLLAGLGDIALFPLEGSDVTGFRVSDLCGFLTFGPLSQWGVWGGYLGSFLCPRLANCSLPLWSCSSMDPWPHARQPRTFCKVCCAA